MLLCVCGALAVVPTLEIDVGQNVSVKDRSWQTHGHAGVRRAVSSNTVLARNTSRVGVHDYLLDNCADVRVDRRSTE